MKKTFFCILAFLWSFELCLAIDDHTLSGIANESACDIVGASEENRIIFDFAYNPGKVFLIIPKNFLIKDNERLKGIRISPSSKDEISIILEGVLCENSYIFSIPEEIENVVLVDMEVLTNAGTRYFFKMK